MRAYELQDNEELPIEPSLDDITNPPIEKETEDIDIIEPDDVEVEDIGKTEEDEDTTAAHLPKTEPDTEPTVAEEDEKSVN